jgi:aminopeptidase YwaD
MPAARRIEYHGRVKLLPLFVTTLLVVPAAVETASRAASRITEASVRSHMEFLAGDALNGRASGSRDEWIAAAYIGAQLRRWGIEPLGDDGGYVQDVRIERSELAAPPTLSFGSSRLTHGKEIAIARLGGTRVSGPLQRFRPGAAVSKGAVLLLPEGTAPAGVETAAASMTLALESTAARERRLAGPPRPLTVQQIAGVPPRAAVLLDKDSYTTISALPDGTIMNVDAQAAPAVIRHTWNAIGRLPGRTPSKARDVILLTAHLDHLGSRAPADGTAAADVIYNGADDDASGSIAVLELAEALASGKRPRRTIIFAWFGSEESGGAGATHFIEVPPVPLDTIVANLEFEMIGRADKAVPPDTLWLTGYERTTLGPALAKRGAKIVADPHPEQNFFARSDNIQLARRGVVAQTVSSFGLHPDYHQPSDEVKTIDFAHMTASIRAMIDPVLWLANSKFRPEWLPGKKP